MEQTEDVWCEGGVVKFIKGQTDYGKNMYLLVSTSDNEIQIFETKSNTNKPSLEECKFLAKFKVKQGLKFDFVTLRSFIAIIYEDGEFQLV